MNSATGGHPTCSREGTGRDFFVVEGELRGDESEEGRRDGNGRLASNAQGTPFAFSPAANGSSTCVNDAVADKATGEDDKDEKRIEISAWGGGGGKEALCGPARSLSVVAGRRTSFEQLDPPKGEDYPWRRANTGDGGGVKSADDLRERGLKGASVEHTSKQLWLCDKIVGLS